MLQGKTVVITGAARGLGREIAVACGRHGATLIIGDILKDLGLETVARLQADGIKARFLPVDLADPESIAAFGRDIAGNEGTVHGLVNNAAIATNVGGARLEDIEIELWDRVMRVNVRGTWLVTKALSPLLPKGAQVVNMASDTALWGPPRLLAYVTSKGAVISMTRSMAREFGPRGIGAVCVAPGIMKNEATDYVPAERHQEYETRRAVPGPQFPEDIVDIVAFLLTPQALPLTGQVITTDAGFNFN
jgi:NAD(P)-dependent dehydrogenase (short-subunit alcohol dehydrogenase family)